MLLHGLKIVQSQGNTFDWDLSKGGYRFHLRVDKFDPTFVHLPRVRLLQHPEGLPIVLTHVNPDKTLCYFERAGMYLDPYEPRKSLVLILAAIEKTVSNIIDVSKSEYDFAQEFNSYWSADSIAYLLDKGSALTSTLFKRRDAVSGKSYVEWVLHAQNGQRLASWLKKRSAEELLQECTTVVVPMHEPPRLPAFGGINSWPPNRWGQFYEWITSLHPVTANELTSRLSEALLSSLKLMIVFSSPGNELEEKRYFAVKVTFDRSVQEVARRYIGSRKPGKKRPKIRVEAVRAAFRKAITSNYARLSVWDVSTEFILGRNMQTETLLNKRIAIIGCGTVGAAVANLLIKVGAGTGSLGKISFYDSDYLKPSNVGRHLLGEEYIGHNKAEALEHYLSEHYTWGTSIKSYPCDVKNHSQIEKLLSSNDLVLDLTGMQQFSTFISHVFRGLNRNKNTPCGTLLYGWVDANGLAARVLLDDNCFACYRCLLVDSQEGLVERFALKGKSSDWPEYAKINFACGESYTPYAEGVSLVVAGLIQGMVIDFFNENPSPRFRHMSLHPSVPYTKSQNVRPLKFCPCSYG